MHHKRNPIDELILALNEQYKAIPDFHEKMKDADVKRAHLFVSVGMLGIQETVKLVTQSFLIGVNKSIQDTKRYIATSKFRSFFDIPGFDVEDTKHETIRLGYVLSFHKYENFVKSFMQLYEEFSVETTKESTETLGEYLVRRFKFNPKSWHEFPSVHIVNFISNCTKHADGKCRLDNPRFNKPFRYLAMSDDEVLKPTVQQYKEDMERLIKTVEIMVGIVASANLLRVFENEIKQVQTKPEKRDSDQEYLYNGERLAILTHSKIMSIILDYRRL